jgi:hypothetical protein
MSDVALLTAIHTFWSPASRTACSAQRGSGDDAL